MAPNRSLRQTGTGHGDGEVPIGDLVSRIAREGRDLAAVEIARGRAELAVRARAGTRVAVGGALAAVFGLLGLMAVVVAAIVGLASTGLGAGWGTAIVGGALLVASASAAMSIRRPAAKMLAREVVPAKLPEQKPRALGEGERSRQAPEPQGGPS